MGEQGEKLLRERSERVEFQVKRCRWKQEEKVCVMVESRNWAPKTGKELH